jgi:hypothetical protein
MTLAPSGHSVSNNTDLRPLDYFEQAHAPWPKNLLVPIMLNMSRLLLLKLEQHNVINHTNTGAVLCCAVLCYN